MIYTSESMERVMGGRGGFVGRGDALTLNRPRANLNSVLQIRSREGTALYFIWARSRVYNFSPEWTGRK